MMVPLHLLLQVFHGVHLLLACAPPAACDAWTMCPLPCKLQAPFALIGMCSCIQLIIPAQSPAICSIMAPNLLLVLLLRPSNPLICCRSITVLLQLHHLPACTS
jgi:hypothetical protein